MKKWIIILLIIILSSGLYLYQHNNWQHKLKQLDQFKQEINQPLKISKEVELNLVEEKDKSEQKIVIKSPFQSDLKLKELEQSVGQKNKEATAKETDKQESMEVSRPSFELLGILKNNNEVLVTIIVDNQIKRLTTGDKVNGYKLINININNVVFNRANQKFSFWLGNNSNPNIINSKNEGGNSN